MRKLVLVAAGMAMAALVATEAGAAVKAYWDQATGKWLKYDTEAGRVLPGANGNGGVVARNSSPIKRQVIDYDGPFRANTIVINTAERRLYYVLGDGKALRYGVGVGREGFQWSGTDLISRKAEWPGWTPPPEMIARERKKGRILPAYMEGGPKNPLGARALYIGGTLYRIHGSNEPWTIGRAVSSGCIRLTNDDVVHLYERVRVGTRVVVLTGKESSTQLAALASPPRRVEEEPAPEVAEAVAEEATGAAEGAPVVKDDDVVVMAPAEGVDEAAETGSIKNNVRVKDDDVVVLATREEEPAPRDETVKDDDVVVIAPAVEEIDAATGARVKDDEMIAPSTPDGEDVTVVVDEKPSLAAN